ncbi:LRR receptor-like serine/threonine-protein kinase EFR isoform X1 [Magnolia sinica]|uniref:LRR receptor-like serine/threonine-protein kinase EFR isoform X1 n=1 Tax=Magnolia sinica TaxID=86752 RepID=UPI00265AF115|nr:LRR receptor-like serine/threonine-protein kinase EFR isoform X1 [Magnolia sinica]
MEIPPMSSRAIWSFLLLSSIHVPCFFGSASPHFSNETDRLALLKFKHLITNDPLHSLSSWNDTLHFCRWHGVTCGGSRHPQRVTALELTNQKLVGPISPYIANLTFLRIIDLSANSFHGTIPEEIGRLFRLQYLRLTNNTFNGEIPANLTHCSKLKALDLYGNQLQELFKATDGFSSANLIGTGSFGTVYKGVLDRVGTMVAVKVFNLQQQGALRSFMAECEALRNIRHRNLVKIITSCSSIDFQGNDFKALVYEYMPNGSLEKWLHGDGHDQLGRKLKFTQMLNIAIDVAFALDYLHNDCETSIIHRDLKPSNILLDDDMTAHVGDFGLARFLSEVAQTSSVGMKGSIGYIAPEYAMGNKASAQGDVYSYGILLLEMITGKGPTDDMFKDNLSLHHFAKLALPE